MPALQDRRSHPVAVAVWTDPAGSFESGAERECAAITNLTGYGVNRGVRLFEEIGGQVDSPLGEICHWWHADEVSEAAGQRRSGHPGPPGERGHRPRMVRVAVYESQDGPDDGIPVGSI